MLRGSALVIKLKDGATHRIAQNCTTSPGWRWYEVKDTDGNQIAAFRSKDIAAIWIEP